jgi:hypothetical protein
MKEVFKYTFSAIADVQKFLFVVIIISILNLIEPFPFIGITALGIEKLLLLSVGVFLIYIAKRSKDADEFYENLKLNGFGTFMFHFIPVAAGILLGLILIATFWVMFLILILQFTNSVYILADPHGIFISIAHAPVLTQILLGFYSIYFMFYSYVFLGKFGEALSSESFKNAFLAIVTSLIDFKYWIETFNLKYFVIYFIWSLITLTIYSALSFTYIFVIFPAIVTNPNLSLVIIPVLAGISVILSYFTFFSAYFAHKTTRN